MLEETTSQHEKRIHALLNTRYAYYAASFLPYLGA